MQIKFTSLHFFRWKGMSMFIMKTLFLLFCTTAFSLAPNATFSQNAKVTIASDKTMTIYEVLELIGEQTECTFIYQSDIFNDVPNIQLKSGVIKVMTLLSQCLPARNFKINSNKEHLITIRRTYSEDLQKEPIQVKGTIKDINGVPLAGATIIIKGTMRGTTSDFDGNYEISANSDDVLIVSYLGYKSIEQQINGQAIIPIILQPDAENLQEVVINAGYYSVKSKEQTGSISRITSKDIENQPVPNVIATMQGRMPGVNIVQESGIAGGGYRINIRGLNSLRENANNPLYIIDGVPYSSDPISDAQTSSSIPGDGNPLASLNPADVESIEILKDADATAIYGSRGANGVVLITTKGGKIGKTTLTINSTHSIGTVTKMMDLMHTEQYLDMRRKAFANDGITDYPFNAYDINGTWDQNRYTDWQKVLIGDTSHISALQASVTGGNAQTKYILSSYYRTESSVFPGDFLYKKGGARLNFNHTSTDRKFNINLSGSYTLQDNDLPWIDFVTLSRQLAPNAPALFDDEGNLNWEDNTWTNPLSNLESKSLATTTDLIVNTTIDYQLNEDLSFNSSFGFTELHNDESRSIPSTIYNPAYNLGSQYSSVYMNTFKRKSWIIEPKVNWQKDFGKSRFTLLAGATFQNQISDKFVILASGFSSNSLLYDLASASETLVRNNDELVYKYQAFFGRANYNYADKYFLNITGRRDGSSRFGPGKQFATFGAVGAAWLFSKETAIAENMEWLSFGKLRASYGVTGSDQIGDYQFLNTYTSSGFQYGGSSGLMPSQLYNANFGWETNKKFEASLELGFLNDRMLLTTSWYKNRSSNQLVGFPLPATTGFSSIQANLDASVENTGFEATLRLAPIQKEHFSWVANINFTKATNKLLSFPGLEESSYRSQFIVGQPTTIQKLFNFTGVNPETGLYEFEDVNGDGEITFENDREAFRDFNPEFYGGILNQFNYKNFELDFLFQFVKQENFNLANTQRFAGLLSNQPTAYIDSWHQPGDVKPYQMFSNSQDARQASDFFALSTGAVSDASYIRFKNISLSYNFPRELLKHMECRLSLQAQNLFTITSFKGADPEFTQGGTLPPLRIFSVGIQLAF